MMTTLILVRHGESEANKQGVFAGHLDTPLAERGFVQARKTAEYINERYAISRVYSSDLKRAFNTGKAIAEKTGNRDNRLQGASRNPCRRVGLHDL